eukprot:Rmarinus@m.3825
MRGFFSQFGEISRLRISRNKKTGKSKHYAFIEFACDEVAKIVADVMHGYLLFNHVMKAKVLSPEEVHPRLFDGANKRYRPFDWAKRAQRIHDGERTAAEQRTRVRRLMTKDRKRQQKLDALGIDFKIPTIDQSALGPRSVVLKDD